MNVKIAGRMCCKFLVLGSLAAFLFIGLPAFARPFSTLPQQGQQAARQAQFRGRLSP